MHAKAELMQTKNGEHGRERDVVKAPRLRISEAAYAIRCVPQCPSAPRLGYPPRGVHFPPGLCYGM